MMALLLAALPLASGAIQVPKAFDTSGWVGAEYTPWRASNELWWAHYAEYRDDVGWGAAQMGVGAQPVYEAGYNNYYPTQPSSGRVSAGAPRGILKNVSRA